MKNKTESHETNRSGGRIILPPLAKWCGGVGGWSIVCEIPGNDHNSEVITTDASQCGFCDYNYLLLLLRVFMAFYFSGFFPSSIYRTMTYD